MVIRRSRAALTVALISVMCLVFTLQRYQGPPLSVNYQYFKDFVFRSHTRTLGANNHVDTRFAPRHDLSVDETRESLLLLLSSFSSFMAANNMQFWIAHGTLLGWQWNQRLLPWDTEIDVQVPRWALLMLVSKNNTFHTITDIPQRKYFLDINPFFNEVFVKDPANVIDARWVDTKTGKFIDITATYPRFAHVPAEDLLSCKDGHTYKAGAS